MNVLDGRTVRHAIRRSADAVVIGSGPGGAAVARILARSGRRVIVLEAGDYHTRFAEDGFTAMTRLYRSMGASLSAGRAPIPLVQGRAVGGTSVINGAICWRLPREVHTSWLAADPGLEAGLPWDRLDAAQARVEADLNIAPTDPDVAGTHNLLLAKGAEALGLEHRPIRRNVEGCEGLGRCLQGCPEGHKLSMDRSYLPDACSHGAQILAGVSARRILHRRGRVCGVKGLTQSGRRVRIDAPTVVVAAGVIHSAVLLLDSGLKSGPVGEGFSCHPGVSVAGRFAEPVHLWKGATQGHEVIGLRREGIKIEAMGYDRALVAARVKGVGRSLATQVERLAHQANWGAAIKSTARGSVWRVPGLGPQVRFDLTRADLVRVRRSVRVLGELLLAAGAEEVTPGVHGWHSAVTDRAVMARFETEGPLRADAYLLAATHLFGTCRMGSDPRRSVIGPDFQHHRVRGLYVSDASVFPTNTGVNPQTAILALSTLCGEAICAA